MPRSASKSTSVRASSASSRTIILQATGLCKSYQQGKMELPILKGVDLTIHDGEFLAIMGASGSGKTTLLNCLSGLDDIDSGSVTIGGQDLAGMDDRARTRHRGRYMGFVFQSFNLIPVLTAEQNVQAPLLLADVRRPEARRRALEALDHVGLAARGKHRPGELSGGEQQRVAIARALVNDPHIVWADEPTGNLDRKTGDLVLEQFRELNERKGTTMVIVTHDAEVARRADRTVVMEDGVLTEREV